MLKKCLAGIQGQSRPADAILVIDNGSTDGTAEWLSQSELLVVRQANEGGASGFYAGIERAFELDFDWVWLMDDDGIPHRSALAEAVAAMPLLEDKYKVLNSRVIYTNHPDRISIDPTSVDIQYTGACFFNGTFVSRDAYERIGNVNKKLFLWGDEANYAMRTNRVYGAIPVINRSVHFHPPFLLHIAKAPLWRQYLLARNTVFNSFNHSRYGRFGVLFAIYEILRRTAIGEIRVDIAAVGVKEGLRSELPSTKFQDIIKRFN